MSKWKIGTFECHFCWTKRKAVPYRIVDGVKSCVYCEVHEPDFLEIKTFWMKRGAEQCQREFRKLLGL